MEDKLKISIVLPVYNEEGILRNNIQKLQSYLRKLNISYEIIICDDHSIDGTWQEALSLIKDNSKIKYLRFNKRIGKGGTIKNSIEVAKGNIILMLDADLPINLNQIPKIVTNANNSLVIGIRDSNSRATQTFLRRFLSHIYNSLVNLIFLTKIKDHQCGAKALPIEAAKKLFPKIRCDGFMFDTELIVHAKREGMQIVSMPIQWRELRRSGSKIIPLRVALTMLADLVILRITSLFGRNILKLKQVEEGSFTCMNDGKSYSIRFTRIDGNQEFLNVLRKIYLTIAFGRER